MGAIRKRNTVHIKNYRDDDIVYLLCILLGSRVKCLLFDSF